MAGPPKAIGKCIMERAKHIRRQHPNMQWQNAVKQAGSDYRAGKLSKKPKSKKK
ncbi:MAG: hypothetical protein QW303_02670 [Nitrososphaerota archaeon]